MQISLNLFVSNTYHFYARAQDEAGNRSSCSTSSAQYVLALTPPQISAV
ncbi:MAG: hypothetical protein ACXWRZ_13060 [Bdellovibrio sp.]